MPHDSRESFEVRCDAEKSYRISAADPDLDFAGESRAPRERGTPPRGRPRHARRVPRDHNSPGKGERRLNFGFAIIGNRGKNREELLGVILPRMELGCRARQRGQVSATLEERRHLLCDFVRVGWIADDETRDRVR